MWVFIAGLWLGAAGSMLVGGWALARYPDAHESPDLPDQPMPSLLWQVGVGLALVGGVAVVGAARSSPPLGSVPPDPMSELAERVAVLGLLGSIAYRGGRVGDGSGRGI